MKKNITTLIIFITGTFLILFIAGCNLNLNGSARVTHLNQDLILVDITDASSSSLPSSSTRSVSGTPRRTATAPGGGAVILRAEVTPPQTPDGTVLQASHVNLSSNGKYAFVSYMLRGERAYGGLDIFDITDPSYPLLISDNLFEGIDISVVAFDGSYVYIGGQKIDQTAGMNNAYVRALRFTGNKLVTTGTPVERSLPGYFTTDIAVGGDTVYAATGTINAGGDWPVGIYALSTGTLSDKTSVTSNLPDLRSVVTDGSDVAVFEAQRSDPAADASLILYTSNLVHQKTISLPSADVEPESKAGMSYIDSFIAIAANKNGVLLVDPDNGSVVTTISAPSLGGIDPSLQTSNSVSSGEANSKKMFFIANGEGGLWVGDSDKIKESDHGVVGTLRFGSGESVNYAAAKNRTVVAAVGTGGLKIIELAVK